MQDITHQFQAKLFPRKALVIYASPNKEVLYTEAYDLTATGRPINRRPLTVAQAGSLGKLMNTKAKREKTICQSKGLMPEQVLYTNIDQLPEQEYVIWYTPPQSRPLLFIDKLGIPNGPAQLPGLIWKATRSRLRLWATQEPARPTLKTRLYQAPFLNINHQGWVCMGTVKITKTVGFTGIEDFMGFWETNFFHSYFSHANSEALTKSNIIQLWQDQIANPTSPFPLDELLPQKLTLADLLQ